MELDYGVYMLINLLSYMIKITVKEEHVLYRACLVYLYVYWYIWSENIQAF